jgi:hypothetical protein
MNLPPEIWTMILEYKKKHYAARLVNSVIPNLDYIYERFFTSSRGTCKGLRGYSMRQACYFVRIVINHAAHIVKDHELIMIIDQLTNSVNGWRRLFVHLNKYYPLPAKYVMGGDIDFWELFSSEYPETDQIVFQQYLEDQFSDAADTFGRDLSSELHYSDSD